MLMAMTLLHDGCLVVKKGKLMKTSPSLTLKMSPQQIQYLISPSTLICILPAGVTLSLDTLSQLANAWWLSDQEKMSSIVSQLSSSSTPSTIGSEQRLESKLSVLNTTSEERKKYPMARGLLDYFPDALAEV